MFFPGQNSRLFHLASKLDEHLRAGMLINEIRNKMGKEIEVKIGHPIDYSDLAPIRDRQALLDYLQSRVMELKLMQ
ncbi:MAG: hypothetical protein AAF741_05895 [Bacteroidota bacterium]